ncbi:MAG: hypothetical protein JW763_05795, partial [candidate division Zixibacteria bacterium]|nr:hypothetical protein [candidate division Zixibacteria bacterium]
GERLAPTERAVREPPVFLPQNHYQPDGDITPSPYMKRGLITGMEKRQFYYNITTTELNLRKRTQMHLVATGRFMCIQPLTIWVKKRA